MRARGFTLIELMVAMVLGLVVIGGVLSVLLANKRSYRTNEGLSQIEETSRSAFELLARDFRQTAANGCDNSGRVANVLSPGTAWWQTWFGMAGYGGTDTDPAVAVGTGTGQRVTGTDSIEVQSIDNTGMSVKSHDPASASIKINAATTPFTAGDILMVCDFDHATIFQVSSYDVTNVAVANVDGAGTPGNCSKGLGYPTSCGSSTGNVYQFNPNSEIARFTAVDWYIGNNGRPEEGGRSLYRRRLGPAATLVTEEIVAGVTSMQIQYRVSGNTTFVAASAMAAGDWANVNALTITLTMTSADRYVSSDMSVNSGRLQRRFTYLVTLRNRVP